MEPNADSVALFSPALKATIDRGPRGCVTPDMHPQVFKALLRVFPHKLLVWVCPSQALHEESWGIQQGEVRRSEQSESWGEMSQTLTCACMCTFRHTNSHKYWHLKKKGISSIFTIQLKLRRCDTLQRIIGPNYYIM